MFSDLFYQLWDKGEFLRAIWETVYMTLLSTLVAYGIGLPLACAGRRPAVVAGRAASAART